MLGRGGCPSRREPRSMSSRATEAKLARPSPPLATACARRARRGFSMIELLVVIGIIAVLVSILLPAIAAARRQANTLKCLSNLRQLGYGFHAYAHNHKGALPVSRQDLPDKDGVIEPDPKKRQSWYWEDFIMPYVSKFGPASGQTATLDAVRNTVMWGCS